MPLTKNVKGKEKKKKKLKKKAGLDLHDMFNRSQDEVKTLKDHLAIRTEFTRRAESAASTMRQRLTKAEQSLQDHVDDHKDINANITRQYKTMQADMSAKVHDLELKLKESQLDLEQTRKELGLVQEEAKQTLEDGEKQIADLKMSLISMEKAYEAVLKDSLGTLEMKLEGSKKEWERHSTTIQRKSNKMLLELGLNPLCI